MYGFARCWDVPDGDLLRCTCLIDAGARGQALPIVTEYQIISEGDIGGRY